MNKRLIFGIILLLPILTAAFIGPLIAPYPKSHSLKVGYVDTPEGKILIAPPTAPSKDYLLGTNSKGQDILSLLLYGARWTIFTVMTISFFKVILGGVIGITRAFGPFHPMRTVRSGPLNALPLVIFIYFLLAPISLNFPFHPIIPTTLFALITIIFGLPAASSSIEAGSRIIMKMEYFTAAKSSGAGRVHLIFHHIIPMIKERMTVLFITETIGTLSILGQLAIFGIFLGGTIRTFSPTIDSTRVHDWAGLTGQARFHIFSDQWILISPLIAYITILLSLHLINEGLQIQFQKTYRK